MSSPAPTAAAADVAATATAPAAAPSATDVAATSTSSPTHAAATAAATPAAATSTAAAKQKKKRKQTAESLLRCSIRIALVCQSNLNRSMEAHWLLQEEGNIRSYSFGAGTKVRLPGESIDRPHVYEFGTTYDAMYKDLERANRVRYTKNGMLQMLDRDRQLKLAPERWQDHYDRYANDGANKRSKKLNGASGSGSAASADAAAADDDDDSPPLPAHFDLIITYEQRVYDIVQADVEARSHSAQSRNQPAHLLNIDTTDNHAEAAVSAALTLELVRSIYEAQRKARGLAADADDADADGDDPDADVDADAASWQDSIDDIIDEFETKHSKEVAHTVLFY